MISTRYGVPVSIILALAIVPTVIHSYLNLTIDDGVSVKNINPVLDNFTSSLSKRNAGYGEETFGSRDWIERIYNNEEGKSIRLFIVKGYDHKRLYHHPELALSYAKGLSNAGQLGLTGQNETPVNLLKNDTSPNIAAYALLYEGKFIDKPIQHQVLDSLNLLVSARKPMVLFYISDDSPPTNTPFNETTAALLLTKAIATYKTQSISESVK
jgi:hypothetical protein